jgi:hypothetical protein
VRTKRSSRGEWCPHTSAEGREDDFIRARMAGKLWVERKRKRIVQSHWAVTPAIVVIRIDAGPMYARLSNVILIIYSYDSHTFEDTLRIYDRKSLKLFLSDTVAVQSWNFSFK